MRSPSVKLPKCDAGARPPRRSFASCRAAHLSQGGWSCRDDLQPPCHSGKLWLIRYLTDFGGLLGSAESAAKSLLPGNIFPAGKVSLTIPDLASPRGQSRTRHALSRLGASEWQRRRRQQKKRKRRKRMA